MNEEKTFGQGVAVYGGPPKVSQFSTDNLKEAIQGMADGWSNAMAETQALRKRCVELEGALREAARCLSYAAPCVHEVNQCTVDFTQCILADCCEARDAVLTASKLVSRRAREAEAKCEELREDFRRSVAIFSGELTALWDLERLVRSHACAGWPGFTEALARLDALRSPSPKKGGGDE